MRKTFVTALMCLLALAVTAAEKPEKTCEKGAAGCPLALSRRANDYFMAKWSDPTVVRVAWACFTVFSTMFPGVILYFILALIMPANR